MSLQSSLRSGVLLVNLGTTSAPTPRAIRRYLAEFLQDRRVVDLPRWLWYPVLRGVILPLRAGRLSKEYQRIWTTEGSPLLAYSRQLQAKLKQRLEDIPVVLAMTYGSPSVDGAIQTLLEQGVEQLIVLPLYPQYSSTTTAAVFDRVARALQRRRDLPSLYFIRDYAQYPAYIQALAQSIQQAFQQHGKPDLLLFSYHGIPIRYVNKGDAYPQQCVATTEAVVSLLQLQPHEYVIGYQSRFGRDPWLAPSTEEILRELPSKGVQSVQVICPGFAADCLETLEEIAIRNRRDFLAAGGQQYHYIPALNAQDQHVDALEKLCQEVLMTS